MNVVRVDFNGFDPDGRLAFLAEHADGPIEVGGTVTAQDGDGNSVRGKVDELRENGLGFLSVDMQTWVAGP